jgi:uncharacterized repeat protein (TIGR01451 family)
MMTVLSSLADLRIRGEYSYVRDRGDLDNVVLNCAPAADLAVTKADSPDPVTVGNNLIYTVVVTNNGPWEATGAMLTDTLPASVTFVSALNCTEGGGTVTCNLGTLASGASATVTIVVNPTKEGMITNTVSVTGNVTDLKTANSTATENTTVTALSEPEPSPAAVPEASTLLLLGSGLASLAGYAGLRLRARRLGQRPSPKE